MTTEMWRVVTSEKVLAARVETVRAVGHGDWQYIVERAYMVAPTARHAVTRWAAWDAETTGRGALAVSAILAPGELSAEERVAAERARCAAVCREVADAHAADYGGEYGAALECAAAILRGLGLGKLSALNPKVPIIRYERAAPGELIHLDIKKLGKFNVQGHRITGDRRKGRSKKAGWDFLHVCVDDASRLARSRW